MWCTFCRCLRKHLKCPFLQIEFNNRLLYMFQQSIKVSLITVSLEQFIYLFLTRCCLLPIPPRTLQSHPCSLEQRQLRRDCHRVKKRFLSLFFIKRPSSCSANMTNSASKKFLHWFSFNNFVRSGSYVMNECYWKCMLTGDIRSQIM
jgi:hypothetical protein